MYDYIFCKSIFYLFFFYYFIVIWIYNINNIYVKINLIVLKNFKKKLYTITIIVIYKYIPYYTFISTLSL